MGAARPVGVVVASAEEADARARGAASAVARQVGGRWPAACADAPPPSSSTARVAVSNAARRGRPPSRRARSVACAQGVAEVRPAACRCTTVDACRPTRTRAIRRAAAARARRATAVLLVPLLVVLEQLSSRLARHAAALPRAGGDGAQPRARRLLRARATPPRPRGLDEGRRLCRARRGRGRQFRRHAVATGGRDGGGSTPRSGPRRRKNSTRRRRRDSTRRRRRGRRDLCSASPRVGALRAASRRPRKPRSTPLRQTRRGRASLEESAAGPGGYPCRRIRARRLRRGRHGAEGAGAAVAAHRGAAEDAEGDDAAAEAMHSHAGLVGMLLVRMLSLVTAAPTPATTPC